MSPPRSLISHKFIYQYLRSYNQLSLRLLQQLCNVPCTALWSNLTALRHLVVTSSLLKAMHWTSRCSEGRSKPGTFSPVDYRSLRSQRSGPHAHHARCAVPHSVPPAPTPLLLSAVCVGGVLPATYLSLRVPLRCHLLKEDFPHLPCPPNPPTHTCTQTPR